MQWFADAAAPWAAPSGAIPPAVYFDLIGRDHRWMIIVGVLGMLGVLLSTAMRPLKRPDDERCAAPCRPASTYGFRIGGVNRSRSHRAAFGMWRTNR